MAGIYGGDGELLSLQATFPQLRSLELEHGSVLRGLGAPDAAQVPVSAVRLAPVRNPDACRCARREPPAHHGVLLEGGSVRAMPGRYAVDAGSIVQADGVVIAAPASAAARLLAELDSELSHLLAGIPYASSALVTLAYRLEDVPHPLDGYGYLVPAVEGSDVLACTWSSSKWEGRAPEGHALIRVYLRRIPRGSDDRVVDLARAELTLLGIEANRY